MDPNALGNCGKIDKTGKIGCYISRPFSCRDVTYVTPAKQLLFAYDACEGEGCVVLYNISANFEAKYPKVVLQLFVVIQPFRPFYGVDCETGVFREEPCFTCCRTLEESQ